MKNSSVTRRLYILLIPRTVSEVPRSRRRKAERPKRPRIGNLCIDDKIKSYTHFYGHCSTTAKAQGKYTRRQNIERYRRLLKNATDKARGEYLNRLILEEQQKQKDAGDSNYQY